MLMVPVVPLATSKPEKKLNSTKHRRRLEERDITDGTRRARRVHPKAVAFHQRHRRGVRVKDELASVELI